MRAKEDTENSASSKIGTDSSEELPEDIDIEKRKDIIRRELEKLIGKKLSVKEVQEKRRIKQLKFDNKKVRKKIADKSRRRNIGS